MRNGHMYCARMKQKTDRERRTRTSGLREEALYRSRTKSMKRGFNSRSAWHANSLKNFSMCQSCILNIYPHCLSISHIAVRASEVAYSAGHDPVDFQQICFPIKFNGRWHTRARAWSRPDNQRRGKKSGRPLHPAVYNVINWTIISRALYASGLLCL